MKRTYTTKGTLFFVPTLTGDKGIVGIDYSDYEKLLAAGIMDEEVIASFQKVNTGSEYEQGAPTAYVKAGLYTITVEGTNAKPQMDIPESEMDSIRNCGLRDGDSVSIFIESLPYRSPREASYEGIKLDMDL